jgi:hypothetical protein
MQERDFEKAALRPGTGTMKNPAIGTLLSLLVLLVPPAEAGRPDTPGGGSGKPGPGGGKVPPNPDLVYMSDDNSSDAVWQASVRGIEFSEINGQSSSRDVSLLRSKTGRQYQSIAWSPDGKQFAWIELGNSMASTPISILVGAPGRKPLVVYSADPGDSPRPHYGEDMVAWGWACDDIDHTRSILAFASDIPTAAGEGLRWGIFGIVFADGIPQGPPEVLWQFQVPTSDFLLRTSPHAFAFSPQGCHLAFAGTTESEPGSPLYGIWKLHTGDGGIEALRSAATFHPHSMDWDRHADHDRLLLAVTNAQSPDWRNLMIIDLAGDSDTEIELFVDEPGYEGYSSEHSPQWGPATSDGCESIAFSRSWWNTNPETGVFQRGLYLLDIDLSGTQNCQYSSPVRIDADWPRALDWR